MRCTSAFDASRDGRVSSRDLAPRLVKTFGFEAAHFLPSFPEGHKCRRMHGHSFKVDVIVEGEIPPGSAYLMDYAQIKAAIDPLERQLDHVCLNDIAGLEDPPAR